VIAVVGVAEWVPPQPAETTTAAKATAARSLDIDEILARRRADILWRMSVVGVVLIAAAVVLLAAAEWPLLARRFGVDGRKRRERARRKSQLRVVRSESDEFVRDVERDLAALPTIDPRDAKKP
jgi:hypothetical protein